ncbi:MAG: prepilin-type N-terminal cleavage/methylation domain-containing protein [Hansschlegelia sp.]
MNRRGGSDGFTLIETLVALVVVALVMLVAQRGMVIARLGLDRVQSTIAAEAVARSIVETELDRLVDAPGKLDGNTDGIGWTIVAEPLNLPLPAAPPPAAAVRTAATEAAPAREATDPANGPVDKADAAAQQQRQAAEWRPLRVTVSVANGRGRPLTIETVQLVRALPGR